MANAILERCPASLDDILAPPSLLSAAEVTTDGNSHKVEV